MKILKKFVPLIVIISIWVSYIMPIRVYADTTTGTTTATTTQTISDDEFNNFSAFSDSGFASLDGIVGILMWPLRAMLAVNILFGETILSQVVMHANTNQAGLIIDMQDIIFAGANIPNGNADQVNLLDVNFFDINSNSDMKDIRTNVAHWYYILRNIAIGLSLLVLIYLGIRMAISAIAEEKAKYKTMIKDWVVGFVLLFTLHIIMVIILNLNSTLTGIIYEAGNLSSTRMNGYESQLMENMFSLSFTVGWGSIIVVLVMLGMKIAFFWMYLKRVFTIGFLIVISPLITVTYSIDRLGDGKSQALGTWMREFVFNLLIQPFHCIIYLVFVSSSFSILQTGGGLRAIIFAVAAMLFMFKAEDMVKTIFGFRAGSLGKLTEAAAVTSLMSERSSSSGDAKAVGAVQGSNGASGVPGNNVVHNVINGANNVSNRGLPNGAPGASGGAPGANAGTSGANAGTSGATTSSNTNMLTNANKLRATSATVGNKMRSKLNQIKANPKQAAKEAGKNIALGIKAKSIKGLSSTAKYVPAVTMGLVTAGMSGSAITGFAVGKKFKGKFTRKLSDKLDSKSAELNEQIKENKSESMEQALHDQEERDLLTNVQEAHDKYHEWHPNDEQDISERAEELLLNENPEDINDKFEREYARSLGALNEFYEGDSEEGSKQKVLDKANEMNDKPYKPLSKAIDKLIDSPDYQNVPNPEEKLLNDTSKWMAQMDKSRIAQERIKLDMDNKQREIDSTNDAAEKKAKQEEYKKLEKDYKDNNYLNSEEYNQLPKKEQKVANEIYMSKTMMEAKFNTGKDSTSEKSREKANRQLSKQIEKSSKRKK